MIGLGESPSERNLRVVEIELLQMFQRNELERETQKMAVQRLPAHEDRDIEDIRHIRSGYAITYDFGKGLRIMVKR